tara:strand:+ start:1492 stop:2406 length:915 start_codon:yes stop_codon:yes gene_type:complete
VNDLSHHLYKVDELVVGNSLEAVSYAFLNHKTLILNDLHKLNFFDFFEPQADLQKYKLEPKQYELQAHKGTKLVGSSKLEIWEHLVFSLSLSGLLPVHDLVSSIRIEDKNILKVSTKNSRMIRFEFNKLRIFDDENVDGLGLSVRDDKCKVVDWINVRSGMKHEYDYFETEDDFVKEIYFYPSQRLGGGENDDRKDLVSISYLKKEQLEDFNYSDTYVKFKVQSLMKEHGVKGARNGKRADDPNKYAYYSIKIEPTKREIITMTKPLYENEGSFIFDSRNEREVYSQSSQQDGYLNKVYDSLNA